MRMRHWAQSFLKMLTLDIQWRSFYRAWRTFGRLRSSNGATRMSPPHIVSPLDPNAVRAQHLPALDKKSNESSFSVAEEFLFMGRIIAILHEG